MGEYVRNLVDAATGYSQRSSRPPQSSYDYPITTATTVDLLRFIGGVKFLAEIQWRLVWAQRGVPYRFRGRGELPRGYWSAAHTDAAGLYFKRITSGEGFLRRIGTDVTASGATSNVADGVLAVNRIVTRVAPLDPDMATTVGRPTVTQSYAPMCIDLRRLRLALPALTRTAPWLDRQFKIAALASRIFLGLVNHSTDCWLSLLQFGYVSIYTDMLESWIVHRFDDDRRQMGTWMEMSDVPDEPRRFLVEVSRAAASLFPIHLGPIVRVDGDLSVVDIAASTHMLNWSLQFPAVQGALANARARHFEETIQEKLDGSAWAPPPSIRQLRTLRLNGRAIGDVDAIGAADRRLMIVSAKSIVFTEALADGEFNVTRNVISLVEQACESARRMERMLLTHPIGDNYDVSSFDTIVIPVCIPHPVFIRSGTATQIICHDLRSVVTINELEEFTRGVAVPGS
jgi:hypothetical protein